jgi:3-oxosteroid 1-dehydrogenase
VHAGIVELCSPHTLLFNRAGCRFADETFFQGIVPELRRFDAMSHDHPNLPAYLIFDSQYFEAFLIREPSGWKPRSSFGSAGRQPA